MARLELRRQHALLSPGGAVVHGEQALSGSLHAAAPGQLEALRPGGDGFAIAWRQPPTARRRIGDDVELAQRAARVAKRCRAGFELVRVQHDRRQLGANAQFDAYAAGEAFGRRVEVEFNRVVRRHDLLRQRAGRRVEIEAARRGAQRPGGRQCQTEHDGSGGGDRNGRLPCSSGISG